MDSDIRSRVLIAEDDEALLELYTERLQSIDDFEIFTAQDGDQALDRLDDSVDLALLDLTMPGPSGRTVVRTIEDSGLDVPIVVVSGEEPRSGDTVPGEEYLVKPVRQDRLRALVQRLIS
jgi:two-component system OmpR family response regulator